MLTCVCVVLESVIDLNPNRDLALVLHDFMRLSGKHFIGKIATDPKGKQRRSKKEIKQKTCHIS